MATQVVKPGAKQTNAPKAPAGNAKPGTKDDAGKAKEKKTRIVYPALVSTEKDEDGKPKRNKLKEVPADYSPKQHKPLQRRDFEDESHYYELRAQIAERQAKKFRELAEEAKKTGGLTNQKVMKRALAMQKRMNEMLAALKKENPGIDIDTMLAELTASMAPAANGEQE